MKDDLQEKAANTSHAEVDESRARERVATRRRSEGKRRRRHKDLTPEEDNIRRQRITIVKILAAVLVVIGGATWIAGIWNIDEYQHHPRLVLTGKVFVGIGGGVLGLMLLRDWIKFAIDFHRERREKMSRRDSRKRRKRRKVRSSNPSGVSVE